jgi:DNA modification methylase
MSSYQEFIYSKNITNDYFGFEPKNISQSLFDFQQAIVGWSVKKGRAAIFADTGLGKTAMQIEWARQVANHTNGNVLIVAPLCVANQTVREGVKFGVSINYCRSQDAVKSGINITNYEMLKHFDVSTFSGVVLDESSILKSYMGKTKRMIIDACESVQYRLACTATPSPNDYLELGNHAEFLGVMPSNEMIMRFFINDTMEAGAYMLRPHAADKFWQWCASWSVCLSNPSDMGYDGDKYILPTLNQSFVEVSTESLEPSADDDMFRTVIINATSIHKEGRLTAELRAVEVAKLVNESNEPWLVWCNTNYEADALKGLIPNAVDLRGSDTVEKKESSLEGFIDGSIRVLITKPSIAGMGLNLQHCRNMAFVGLSYSYEDYYQAIRRCYRFGQKREVNCYVMAADSERSILKIIQEKEKAHHTMKSEMTKAISIFHSETDMTNNTPYFGKQSGNNWELHHGDCVHVAQKIESGTIDLSVYSPPFSNLYIYSDSEYDMGNSSDDGEFMKHYSFLAEELYRITREGRLTVIHCKDLPMYKGRDGAAGLRDFPGEIIKMYESKGWVFHSRVTIWKDPVIEMQRTKNHGLLYKQLCKDSAASRQGMADYLIVMRKWGDEDKWESVTRGGGERFCDYKGMTQCQPTDKDLARARTEEEEKRLYSIAVWQRYASPVWFDINQTNVLNKMQAKEKDAERHICPLQLDVIERAVELWSNPNDLVFSPFTGIGSEGYVSLKMGRRFVGAELKKSYFDIACTNLDDAISVKQESLF